MMGWEVSIRKGESAYGNGDGPCIEPTEKLHVWRVLRPIMHGAVLPSVAILERLYKQRAFG